MQELILINVVLKYFSQYSRKTCTAYKIWITKYSHELWLNTVILMTIKFNHRISTSSEQPRLPWMELAVHHTCATKQQLIIRHWQKPQDNRTSLKGHITTKNYLCERMSTYTRSVLINHHPCQWWSIITTYVTYTRKRDRTIHVGHVYFTCV